MAYLDVNHTQALNAWGKGHEGTWLNVRNLVPPSDAANLWLRVLADALVQYTVENFDLSCNGFSRIPPVVVQHVAFSRLRKLDMRSSALVELDTEFVELLKNNDKLAVVNLWSSTRLQRIAPEVVAEMLNPHRRRFELYLHGCEALEAPPYEVTHCNQYGDAAELHGMDAWLSHGVDGYDEWYQEQQKLAAEREVEVAKMKEKAAALAEEKAERAAREARPCTPSELNQSKVLKEFLVEILPAIVSKADKYAASIVKEGYTNPDIFIENINSGKINEERLKVWGFRPTHIAKLVSACREKAK